MKRAQKMARAGGGALCELGCGVLWCRRLRVVEARETTRSLGGKVEWASKRRFESRAIAVGSKPLRGQNSLWTVMSQSNPRLARSSQPGSVQDRFRSKRGGKKRIEQTHRRPSIRSSRHRLLVPEAYRTAPKIGSDPCCA